MGQLIQRKPAVGHSSTYAQAKEPRSLSRRVAGSKPCSRERAVPWLVPLARYPHAASVGCAQRRGPPAVPARDHQSQ